MNDPLYNHTVFGPDKGKGGNIGKTDEKLIADLISIHNAENWLGMDGDTELSMFNKGDDGDGKGDIATKILPLDGSLPANKKEGEAQSSITVSYTHSIPGLNVIANFITLFAIS
jgi:hypothetical protein